MSVLSVPFKKMTGGYRLNPALINLPDHSIQGRFSATPKNLFEMIEDLLINGQKQNIIFRKDEANAPLLVAGFRRRAAALKINENRHDKDFRAMLSHAALAKLDEMGDEPMLLDGKLEDIGEEQAFLTNLAENRRVELSPMDRLKIILTLRNRFGKKDDEIAALFGKKAWYVYHHLKLGSLSPRIQELVDDGKISLEVAAKTLAKIPEGEREAMVDTILSSGALEQAETEATTGEGDGELDEAAIKRITGSALAKAERERRAKKGEEGGTTAMKRTLADQKKFWRSYIEEHPVEEDQVSALLADLMAFAEGLIQEVALVRRLKKHLGVESKSKGAATTK